MAKPGEQEDDLTLDEGTPDAGLEAEADADNPDSQDAEDGDLAEGAAEGERPDAAGQEEVAGEVERRPSRGEARFQTLSRSAKEANERAANAERETRDLRERLTRLEQPRQQQPQGKSPEELALMTPDELITHRLGEATRGFEQKLGAIQWATMESGDRGAWNALMSSNPVAARFASKVEAKLAEIRAQGSNAPRENVFKFLVGEEVVAKSGKAKEKQGAAGQRRIASQTTRPGAQQRSDAQGTRGRLTEAEAREKRLENATF